MRGRLIAEKYVAPARVHTRVNQNPIISAGSPWAKHRLSSGLPRPLSRPVVQLVRFLTEDRFFARSPLCTHTRMRARGCVADPRRLYFSRRHALLPAVGTTGSSGERGGEGKTVYNIPTVRERCRNCNNAAEITRTEIAERLDRIAITEDSSRLRRTAAQPRTVLPALTRERDDIWKIRLDLSRLRQLFFQVRVLDLFIYRLGCLSDRARRARSRRVCEKISHRRTLSAPLIAISMLNIILMFISVLIPMPISVTFYFEDKI